MNMYPRNMLLNYGQASKMILIEMLFIFLFFSGYVLQSKHVIGNKIYKKN